MSATEPAGAFGLRVSCRCGTRRADPGASWRLRANRRRSISTGTRSSVIVLVDHEFSHDGYGPPLAFTVLKSSGRGRRFAGPANSSIGQVCRGGDTVGRSHPSPPRSFIPQKRCKRCPLAASPPVLMTHIPVSLQRPAVLVRFAIAGPRPQEGPLADPGIDVLKLASRCWPCRGRIQAGFSVE